MLKGVAGEKKGFIARQGVWSSLKGGVVAASVDNFNELEYGRIYLFIL